MARVYKSRFRVDSAEVQGEGSWVEFQRPTWGMIGQVNDGKSHPNLLLELAVVDWNWTDDNGDPLPLPKDEAGLIERLPAQEAHWLLENSEIGKRNEAKKN